MITALQFVILILAAQRLAGLIIQDDFALFTDLRRIILSRWPGENTRFLESAVTESRDGWEHNGRAVFLDPDEDGTRVWYATFPHPLGRLFECVRCMSAWAAAGLLVLLVFAPSVWWPVAVILAVSQGVILLDSWER